MTETVRVNRPLPLHDVKVMWHDGIDETSLRVLIIGDWLVSVIDWLSAIDLSVSVCVCAQVWEYWLLVIDWFLWLIGYQLLITQCVCDLFIDFSSYNFLGREIKNMSCCVVKVGSPW